MTKPLKSAKPGRSKKPGRTGNQPEGLPTPVSTSIQQYQETPDSGEIWGVAKAPLNSSDADALAEAEATLSGSAADFEAASETSDLPPISQWIFPKLPIYGPRRSGFDEAQAFFEFSRRLAALTENEGANAAQASTAQTERAVDTPGEGTAAAENDAKDDDSEAK